jgi:hypothetical protein
VENEKFIFAIDHIGGSMDVRRKLLWVDGLAAAAGGVAVLLSGSWLSGWYGLPRDLLLLIGGVNVGYALYSLSLAARAERPKALILLLVLANLGWAFVCLQWAVVFADTASLFGVAHLAGEGVFVGVLASLEWRWRELLRAK